MHSRLCEFEMLTIRCELQEPQQQAIARSLGDLNKEIDDLVGLQICIFGGCDRIKGRKTGEASFKYAKMCLGKLVTKQPSHLQDHHEVPSFGRVRTT